MGIEQVTCAGKNIHDKHTYYELWTFIGPRPATIIIPGYIAEEFQKQYGQPITECEAFTVKTDLMRNDQRVRECQDLYLPGSHLTSTIHSLDEISVDGKLK